MLACSDGTEPTPDPEPEPVPNGRIVWSSSMGDPEGWRNHPYSVEADGSGLLQLTQELGSYSILPAPFGAARVSFKEFSADATPQDVYYTMRANRTGLTGPFAFDFHPYDVSPDGSRIVGHSETGEQSIGIGNLLTGETTHLSTAPLVPYEVFWSPTGDRIGFTGRLHDLATSDAYVIRTDGSGLTRLTEDRAYETEARWSPDGRYIVFNRWVIGVDATLHMIDADGSNLKEIYPGFCGSIPLAWSPDGSQVMCSHDGVTEAIIDVESGGSRSTGFQFQCQGWLPDGTRLLCSDDEGIYTLNPDGTDQVQVAPLSGGIGFMAWLREEEE